MKEITEAIAARHAQIKTLQSDIEALQRAATVLGGKTSTTARATPQAKAKPKRKRRPWSAAARRAMSKKVKASWAKRKRARR